MFYCVRGVWYDAGMNEIPDNSLDRELLKGYANEVSGHLEKKESLEITLAAQQSLLRRFGRLHSSLQIRQGENMDNALLRGETEEYMKALDALRTEYSLDEAEARLTQIELVKADEALRRIEAKFGIPPTEEGWVNN